jgi:hypothetical protein
MDIRKKLEAYANEYKATMKHAEEIRNEYLKLAAKQAVIDAFNDLDEDEQMVITLGLLTGAIKESDLFDLEELMLAKAVAEQDMAEDNNEIFTIHLIIAE